MHAKMMYDEEKLGALQELLKMLGGKMADENHDDEDMVMAEDEPFSGKESLGEELAEKLSEKLSPEEEDFKGKMSDFMKNKGYKSPQGISAKLISITAKPRPKMKMKG